MAITAFRQADEFSTCLNMGNGILLDLKTKKIIIPQDFHLHCEGDLVLSSAKHVIISSGRTPESREGYTHSIWFNSKLDADKRPVRAFLMRNLITGHREEMFLEVDAQNKLIVPRGYEIIK